MFQKQNRGKLSWSCYVAIEINVKKGTTLMSVNSLKYVESCVKLKKVIYPSARNFWLEIFFSTLAKGCKTIMERLSKHPVMK